LPCADVYRRAMHIGRTARHAEPNPLPPHLREVCALLAAGILRLRSRTAEETARRPEPAWGSGDIPLHSTARQRLHVLPNREG
jgi:hypothetical protein